MNNINETLVQSLIDTQFPQWKDLPVRAVSTSGWDNRTFHLGEHMLVRLPSREDYALQVDKEQRWLPVLAPHLPLAIPVPLAQGQPGHGYPWKWSVYRWISGETVASSRIADWDDLAIRLAGFLRAMQAIDAAKGPVAGLHSFWRGGALRIYDAETRRALDALEGTIDTLAAREIWEAALETQWHGAPVWVHGDISAGNLLMRDGHLAGVIDFGQLAVGDPACDLAVSWTLFQGKNREAFRQHLDYDRGTWLRGQAWALWKAMMYIINQQTSMNYESKKALVTIEAIVADFQRG
ncbi:aminoglycoside phosphotransferase [Legionella geestiana]|uniref:Aminoglycoside phosphotransferase n=1 Tax=Legionella geestiana TaxID=45065 RepID=A0A0W0TKZ8_9GAMM|nr:aminoglycoside phosphotransferase family protein [Legionella geestiana]KTC95845.1 aminoglycoside phosphotransferase [Legionella geestiana]QBS13257.1 aminoglycoside phosphotransferase family protein [Legionella geestiana]STX54217.1 aminoglycoside phosphotransferase [Legionella geestiana]